MAGSRIDPQAPAPLPESLSRLWTAVDAAARAGDELALACQAESAELLLRRLVDPFEARAPVVAPAAEQADAATEAPPHNAADASSPRRGQVVRRRRRSATQRKLLKKKRGLIALCAGYALLLVGGYLLFGFFKLLIVSLSD